MSQDNIKQELEHLKVDLETIDAKEGTTSEEIQHMLNHVNNALDRFEEQENRDTLLDHMEEAIVHFEANYPQLSGRVRGIINGLSLGGI